MNKFLQIKNFSKDQLLQIIEDKCDEIFLENKTIGFLFEKPSTRTRVSFFTGIVQLKGNVIDLRYEDLNISREESFEDTFKAMNWYLDGLIYRTTNHDKLIEASKYFDKPIINALSNISHPCQIISDLFTLYQNFKSLDLEILWMGDMSNVLYSLIEACEIFSSLKLTICTPKYLHDNFDINTSSNITFKYKIADLDLSKFDCIMTDVFISMNDQSSESKLENLRHYQVNSKIMNKTKDNCVFMHCLPAKVGSEVTLDVINGKKSIVWKQAANRLYAQKNMLKIIYS